MPWPGSLVHGRTGLVRGDEPVPEQPGLTFAGLLRRLRDDAGLTQEELAEAASLSPRSVSDLERGVNLTARHETARLLARALGLTGPQRALFEAAARGHAPASQVLAAGEAAAAAAATRMLPRDIASFTGRVAELAQLADAVTWCRRGRRGWWGSTRSAGWPGSAKRPSRCTRRTGWPALSRTGSFSCRCTRTRRVSGRSSRSMRWPACC